MKNLFGSKNQSIALLLLVPMFITACSRMEATTSASWAYPFVKWNGHTYVVTDETVSNKGQLLGQIKKYSTNELDEFPDNSSNFYPKGTEFYKLPGMNADEYIVIAKKDGTLLTAVEKETWEEEKKFPGSEQGTEKVSAQYEIPIQAGWLNADQVLEKAYSMVEQSQKLGALEPVSLRLTTFDKIAHGGEYLPAETPVWHILFKADGRVWTQTSGPAVLKPEDCYSHTQVINTVEIALQADNGKQVFQGFSGGSLDTTQPLEEIKGVMTEQKDRVGDQITVKTDGGNKVNILLPRSMAASAIDTASGTRSNLTFWQVLNLQPGTSVSIRGLKTKTGEFLSYVLEAEIPNPNRGL